METLLKPVVVPAGTGLFVELGDHRGHAKISSRDTQGDFLLVEVEVDPDGGTPPHIHNREDETFYIQQGRFSFLIGDETIEAGPGDTLFAPRDIPHAWRCISEEGGKTLILITPGANFESFALGMGERGITPLDPACLPHLLALADEHGIEILPPA